MNFLANPIVDSKHLRGLYTDNVKALLHKKWQPWGLGLLLRWSSPAKATG